MISIQGRWIGLLGIGLDELKKAQPSAIRAVTKATLHYENALKKKLTGPRSGIVYTTHQASAPGEPPALNTGSYRQSIGHEIVEEKDSVFGQVGTNDVRGPILEFGGIAGNNARILPRPHFSATFLEEEQTMVTILDEATT